MKKILPLIILIYGCISSIGMAQDLATVEGVIIDAKTGEHLLAANISVQEVKRGISSNTNGYFAIEDIAPGRYTLVCSYIGYQVYKETIEVREGENLSLKVAMVPKSLKLDEIVVKTDQATLIERINVNAEVISPNLINKLPVFESDVFQSMQLLPGIQASSDYSSNLHIRGGSPDQTLILLDNAPVFNPTHFLGFFSTFNPDVIKEIRMFKGAYPASFGGRLGSVLQIKTKRGKRNQVSGSVTASMLASRLSLEGPIGSGSWQIAGRRSTIGPVLDVLRESASGIPDKYYFYDANGKIDLKVSPKNRFSLSFYGGNDHVVFPIAGRSSFYMNYGNRTINADWQHFATDNFFATFSFSGSNYFKQSDFKLAGASNGRDNEILDAKFSTKLEYHAGDNHYFTAGINTGYSEIGLQDISSGFKSFNTSIKGYYSSAFLQDEWTPGQKWKFIPGIRVSYHENGNYKRIEPRFTAEFSASDRIAFHASYGRYNQYLSLMTNESFTGFDIWLPSSKGVEPSSGNQYVFGTKLIPFKNFGLDIEFYYRDMNRLFELDPFLPDWSGLAYQDLFRTGKGYSYGLETIFEKKAGNLTGFIGYSLGYSWRKFPGYNIDLLNANAQARYYPPKYDRRHDLTVVLNYELGRKWEFTTVFTYATGQAYTKVLGRYATINMPLMPEGKRQNVFTVGRINASRLPDYHRLDFAISRKGTFFGIGETDLKLQVINVYSRRNVWFYNYYFQPNPIRQMEIKLLPVLPAISYTIKF